MENSEALCFFSTRSRRGIRENSIAPPTLLQTKFVEKLSLPINVKVGGNNAEIRLYY